MPPLNFQLLLADRQEFLIHPADRAEVAAFAPPRGWPETKALLGTESLGRDNRGRYAVIRARRVSDVAVHQYLGWDRDYRAHQFTFNPLREMRNRLVASGLYPADAPLDYEGKDNFLNLSLVKGVSLAQLYQLQLEILAETTAQQIPIADGLMRPLFGVPSKGRIHLAMAEYVIDLEVPNAHLLIHSMESGFLGLARRGYRGFDGNAVTLKAFLSRDVALTAYTKTPTLVRFQLKLNYKGMFKWLHRNSVLPTTAQGWDDFLSLLSVRLAPILASATVCPSSTDASSDLIDFLLALGGALGNTEDPSRHEKARAFLGPLLASGAIVNRGRQFRTLVDRAHRSGLLMKGPGLWYLPPRFARVAAGFRSLVRQGGTGP